MNKRQLIFIIALIVVMIIIVSVYIELAIKPQNTSLTSKNVNPFAVYFHSNLSIILDNKPVVIPSQIGINESLWKDRSLDKYGVPGMPMDEKGEKNMPGMAPLYTTNDKGRITIGSVIEREYTLGEFLKIWGELDLMDKLVNATVNGNEVANYENITLEDDQQIELYIMSRK
jgi:regulatory protein YycI of two-component signal transduction system YycFG